MTTSPRTLLYAPAHAGYTFDTALDAAPDAVIIDLEDGTAPEDKIEARDRVGLLVELVRQRNIVPVIRINGVGTAWFDHDLDTAVAAKPDAILLPKAGIAELTALQSNSLVHTGLCGKLWALVERPNDVLACDAIAGTGWVAALVIGYGDLCKEMELPLGTAHCELDGVRSLVVAACAKNGLDAFDGVVIGRADTVRSSAELSVRLGFSGRTLYDARHVEPCQAAFDERGDR
jgi:citrate lyase subunit beta / citryl-CoA lyase